MTTVLQSAWMTDLQVAAHFGVSRTTVWRHSKDGVLPKPLKFGRSVRWKRADIEAIGEKQEAKA